MAQSFERVEPPFWWTQMENQELQLMIYGNELQGCQISIEREGLKLVAQHTLDNASYLFIDLLIANDAQAGTYPIKFESADGNIEILNYELKARVPGSRNRMSFNSSDVLYLLTPDRFANGNLQNDEIDGLREGLNREAEYGRHGGDLAGIRNNLQYIKDMGFTAIWLNPVLENDQGKWSYHGYATTDYYKVDSRFGTNEDYVALCREASEMGMGIIMDIIVNHCGSEHWWMKDPPSNDWINSLGDGYTETNHRKTTLVDPYVSKRDRDIMTRGWFVPAMPDLNQDNPFMATYLIQNTIWWIEYAGLYGIRQDTYSYPFRDFMTDWTCAIRNEYPNMNIVGEEWIENPSVIAYWQEDKINHDGYSSCLSSLMDFPMCFALHKSLREEEAWSEGLVRLYEILANDFVYAHPEKMVIFPDNHDMSRILTQLGEDRALTKMALVYILTMRGVPQIYYGTEILMSNQGTDSHGIIRSDFPGGWPGDTINAFTGEGMDAEKLDFQEWMRDILTWRKSSEVIHNGKLMHFEPEDGQYVYFRYDDNNCTMVAMNKNSEEFTLDSNKYAERISKYSMGKDVLTGEEFQLNALTIPGRSARIIELKK